MATENEELGAGVLAQRTLKVRYHAGRQLWRVAAFHRGARSDQPWGEAVGSRLLLAGNILGWGGPFSITFSLTKDADLSLFEEKWKRFPLAQGMGEDFGRYDSRGTARRDGWLSRQGRRCHQVRRHQPFHAALALLASRRCRGRHRFSEARTRGASQCRRTRPAPPPPLNGYAIGGRGGNRSVHSASGNDGVGICRDDLVQPIVSKKTFSRDAGELDHGRSVAPSSSAARRCGGTESPGCSSCHNQRGTLATDGTGARNVRHPTPQRRFDRFQPGLAK